MSLDAIAGTVFTRPEVAGVGLTESKAEEKGVRVAVTRQPLRANPRGLIAGQSDGMIKLVWDPGHAAACSAARSSATAPPRSSRRSRWP